MKKNHVARQSRFGEIETLIRARYPITYVVSWEEERVMREIRSIGTRLGKRVYSWTINDGIAEAQDELLPRIEGRKGTKDPLMALREIMAQNEAAIYVLRDLHPFIKEATITRGLRDLCEKLRSTYTSIILLSPVLSIPPELEKEVTVIDYPLPTAERIHELLQTIAKDLAGSHDLSVDLSNGAEEALVAAAVGLTLNEAENVFAKTLVTAGRLSGAEVPLVFSEKRQIIRKTGLLEYVSVSEQLDHVGGLHELKVWLRKRRLAFTDQARSFGLPAPKGVLILGVQGCGKSLCAKAIPSLWRLPLLRLDMGRLFSSFVGSSEENVRSVIQLAESVQPVILWIDEIDKGFSGIQSSTFSDSGTTARVFGSILTWLQEKTSAVFVVATANQVEVLPPELLRKGRFDEVFFVDLPTASEREAIFNIHLLRRGRKPENFDIPALAAAAAGHSGSEIEQAVISALFDAFAERSEIQTGHILQAIRETVPLSKLMERDITERRRWAQGRTRSAS